MNPNRDTLREPHPAKGWLDIRQAKPPGLVIVIIYSASDTLNMTRDHWLKSHQRNVCSISRADMLQLSLGDAANLLI